MFTSRVLCTFVKRQISFHTQPHSLIRKQNLFISLVTCRLLSTHQVTKNITFLSKDEKIVPSGYEIKNLNKVENRPLLVMLTWLLSKPRHTMKYVQLYLEQGFDAVIISMTPQQLLWPKTGSRVIAVDILTFLLQNESYQQIVIHGFSVGGYVWGEVLSFVHNDRQKYDGVINRIIGQVWDSATDVNEMKIGIPRAIFPNSVTLQWILEKYIIFHMKTFYKQATQYYIRSSQLFHTNLVRTPALFFLSNIDPVGTVATNLKVRDTWESLGTKTFIKIFDNSPHVGHYSKYPREYVAELYLFLKLLNLIQNEEKIRARL